MYTKAQYLNDMMKYDFKKYKVDVVTEGSTYQDLVLKVKFNGKVVYKTNPSTFTYKTVKDGRMVRTKWFIKYEQFERKIVVWKKPKDLKNFISWCSNYRVQNEVRDKVSTELDKFPRMFS